MSSGPTTRPGSSTSTCTGCSAIRGIKGRSRARTAARCSASSGSSPGRTRSPMSGWRCSARPTTRRARARPSARRWRRPAGRAAGAAAISGSVLAARAGAGGVREVISSEMWECLNVAAQGLAGQRRAAERLGPHVFLRFIRERAALFFGLAESTMSHDDAWRFLVLGRSLERADMTARLLLARLPGPEELSWPLLLHACGAYESFIRTHGWAAEPSRVAEFLLLDRLFPRSVLHSLVTAEECLMALNPGPVRMGMDDPARRPVGQLRTRLEYADPALLPDELPELLGQLQQACVEACDAITKRYFQYEAPVLWEREG